MNNLENKKGFALLYAILLSGAVLTVGVILMNIITKQLIYSSINRNSELAYYYAANSGRECLDYYAGAQTETFYSIKKVEGNKYVEFRDPVSLLCFDQNIKMKQSSSSGNKYSYILEGNNISLDGNSIELSVTFNSDCILDTDGCQGNNLEDKSIAVMKAVGYSGLAGDRTTKRVAILVKK